MPRKTVRAPSTAIPPLNRRLLAVAALLAFFLQSLAVQSHIHPANTNFGMAGTVVAAAPSMPGPLTNSDLDRGNCRLCREMVHAGAYITPVAVLLPAILVFVLEAPGFELVKRAAPAPAFTWQSRGPPRR
jgi:hypothetical protein